MILRFLKHIQNIPLGYLNTFLFHTKTKVNFIITMPQSHCNLMDPKLNVCTYNSVIRKIFIYVMTNVIVF